MISKDFMKAIEGGKDHPPMSRAEWWSFMRWNDLNPNTRSPGLYEHLMLGYISYRKPILRFDHPGRKLAERYFSARLCGEKRK